MAEYEWPFCAPPTQNASYSISDDHHTYCRKETSPGVWQWVIDEKAEEFSRKFEHRKQELAFALVSRVLTDEEFQEVERLGYYLYVREWCPYKEEDLIRRFNEALIQQFKLRRINDLKSIQEI